MPKKVSCKGFNGKPHKVDKLIRGKYCSYCTGRAFENEVYVLLSKLNDNKQVLQGKDIDGSQCDIYLIREDIIPVKYLIECKDYEGTVGIEDMCKFVYEFYTAWLSKTVDIGIFVSTNGFSPSAQRKANKFNITLLTFDELKQKVNNATNKYSEFIDELRTELVDEIKKEVLIPAKPGG